VSDFYSRVRNDLVGGGGDPTAPSDERVPLSTSVVGIGVIVALLAWLGSNNVWTLVFVLGLIVSVFLHEIGHFSTARATGMKVTQFYMGFGPRIIESAARRDRIRHPRHSPSARSCASSA